MSRYIGPAIFLAAAVWVYQHNQGASGSILLLPFVDLVPGYEEDVVAQGRLSWQILLGLGGFYLLTRVVGHLRELRARKDEE